MSSLSSPVDTTIEIVTPENIAFHYQVAGPFRRFPAYLLDLLIRGGVLVGLGIAVSILVPALGAASIGIWLLAQFVLSWFYGGLFETYWNGQTPGKRLLGIRVLSTDGRPINGYQAVMRNILRAVDMGPLVSAQVFGGPAYPLIPTFMFALIAMACNRRAQRLGDLVCRTMVVVEERPWFSGMARIEDPRVGELVGELPADLRVSRSLARAIAHYVERRSYFSVPRRREVAGHVAEPLLRRFQLPATTSYDLLLCALYYRLFVADRGEESHAPERRGADALGRGRLASMVDSAPPADPLSPPPG